MRAFLEQYGIAIFTLVITGIMVLMASGAGNYIESLLVKEISKTTDKLSVTALIEDEEDKPGHVMITGEDFEFIINTNPEIGSIEFLSTAAPTGIDAIDVSADKDGSILAWLDGTTFKVAPKEAGHIIYANPDSSYMFFGSDGDSYANGAYLTEIVFNNFDTSKVTNMYRMFWGTGCDIGSFTISGNISDWDVSNVTNMSYMFRNTAWLSPTFKLDLSKWDVSNVTNMRDMFSNVGANATDWSLGDLSKWDVSNVTDMSWMFSGAGARASYKLDLSNWNVSKVTTYNGFKGSSDKIISPWD